MAGSQVEAAPDTHSARTPGSPLPPPPYCSRPVRPCTLKPREVLREQVGGGACMGTRERRVLRSTGAPDRVGYREGESIFLLLPRWTPLT